MNKSKFMISCPKG